MRLQTVLNSLICLCLVSTAFADNLGVHGRTYKIMEPDALTEMESAAQSVDWDKAISKEELARKIVAYRPKGLRALPLSKVSRTRSVDMTHTLTEDVKDANNTVVYPKGYRFNPLDYIKLPSTLVFINPADPNQVKWYKASPYANNPTTTLLITEGSYYEISKGLNQPVYYATGEILNRFKLASVPSIVYQTGRAMTVVEVAP